MRINLFSSRFNPTMVRLLQHLPNKPIRLFARVSIPQWCDCCRARVGRGSNDERVSIPQWCDCCKVLAEAFGWLIICFNPTMVRLLLSSDALNGRHFTSFNPTMVRLLQLTLYILQAFIRMFQSHNGAIAAISANTSKSRNLKSFNPTMVRLLHVLVASMRVDFKSFNPTMVRLLRVRKLT